MLHRGSRSRPVTWLSPSLSSRCFNGTRLLPWHFSSGRHLWTPHHMQTPCCLRLYQRVLCRQFLRLTWWFTSSFITSTLLDHPLSSPTWIPSLYITAGLLPIHQENYTSPETTIHPATSPWSSFSSFWGALSLLLQLVPCSASSQPGLVLARALADPLNCWPPPHQLPDLRTTSHHAGGCSVARSTCWLCVCVYIFLYVYILTVRKHWFLKSVLSNVRNRI